jgi:hypothetical protein
MPGSLAHKLFYRFRTVPGMSARAFYVVPMLALGLGGGDLAAAKTGDVFVAAAALECFTRLSVCSYRQKQSYGIHISRLR